MRDPAKLDNSTYQPHHFRAAFCPSKIWWDLSDVFEEFGTALSLLDELADYYSKLENKGHIHVNPERINASIRAFAKIIPSLEANMILCNFGRASEAAAFSRRIWEIRVDFEYIITEKDFLSFIYNRESAISGIVRSGRLRQYSEHLMKEQQEQFERSIEKLPYSFEGMRQDFIEAGFKPPEDENVLRKKYKAEWFGQSKPQILSKICEYQGQSSVICRSLWNSYAWDFSALSDLAHGRGIYELTIMRHIGGKEFFDSDPSANGIDLASCSALYYSSRAIRTCGQIIGIPLADILAEKVVAFNSNVDALYHKYIAPSTSSVSKNNGANSGIRDE